MALMDVIPGCLQSELRELSLLRSLVLTVPGREARSIVAEFERAGLAVLDWA